ncbi:tetratricopeptide repeat protein [Haliea sp. AH-315-K21]|uniref:Uncharacterized protein n=1 Tax=SAR86 cluster bacterium TaxID=2030880 RepID=A0A2A5C8C0_9GAMM|nr:tetratricopeptide repeat protein [Haliea sp. AH-315-K21]PCJ39993.1 MAG: hypothetical protein COA71_12535 [SAR86 cluster bacterium]
MNRTFQTPLRFLGFLLISTFCLQACTSLEPPNSEEITFTLTVENTGYFGARPEILTPQELHFLTPEQVSNFTAYMSNPAFENIKPHQRLFNFLRTYNDQFQYEADTLIASQSLALKSGNCLSLAILTSALAKTVDLEIDYQLMDDVPVYELNGTIVTKGLHIRTILYDPGFAGEPGVDYLFKPGIKIDYFPTGRSRFIANLDENDYLAMYYQNIAAAAIANNDSNIAYWYAMESLKFVPDNSNAINMLAIINRRVDNLEIAEQLYLYGIELAGEKLTLLKNYRILLSSSGRTEEAEHLQREIDSMQDSSPFEWFQLARNAYDEGDLSGAIRYYQRALDLAPYLHEAHLAIAQINYELGNLGRAENALENAIANVNKVSTRNLYQAKLFTLTSEITN